MSIQSMRNATQKNRWIMIIIAVLLIAGILITYAVSSSVGGTGLTDQEANVEQQIQYYQQAVAALEEELANQPNDYSTLTQLGENYYNLAVMQGANGDSEGMDASLKAGIGYYQDALNNAPENLNDLGKAELDMKIGGMYFYTTEKDTGYEYMREAVNLVPENYDINVTYAYYLWMDGQYEQAIAVLEVLKDVLPADDEHAADLDTTLADLKQSLEEMQNPSATDGQDTAGDGAATDSGAAADGDTTTDDAAATDGNGAAADGSGSAGDDAAAGETGE